MNNRILAIMPHPDDIEILCAGTLLRLGELDYEIHVATMTAGDKGSAVLPRHEIADIRREEAERAAGVLGAASCRCLEFQDLEITFDNPTRQKVAELLREVDAFMIFTTPSKDYMFDHEITSQLVRDASFSASTPNYQTGGSAPPTSGVPYLYYSDAVGGHDMFGELARVSCIIDISAQMKWKSEALKCHDSQRSWLMKQHGMDNYVETMQGWGADRGKQIGVQYAEAFSQHLGHPHPQDDKLSELLDGRKPE